jgi:hypothetical protein
MIIVLVLLVVPLLLSDDMSLILGDAMLLD